MQIKQDVEKSVNLKIECLKLDFEKDYQMWGGMGLADDRRLFCNLYEMLMEACKSMRSVDNLYIWCAFNHDFEKDYNILKRIKENFQSM